jgi:hypothetical protein
MADRLDVCIVTKYQDRDGNEKSRWNRIGAAFPNKLGGFNVKVDALQIIGGINELVLVPPKEKTEGGGF